MLDRWTRRPAVECTGLYCRADRPVLAEWYDSDGRAVTLYFDGTFEAPNGCPVELLPHVVGEWHVHLRGKIA